MGSFSSSAASLPSLLPVAGGCTALSDSKSLESRVRPCSRPFLLPRLAFDNGPWTPTEVTKPGRGVGVGCDGLASFLYALSRTSGSYRRTCIPSAARELPIVAWALSGFFAPGSVVDASYRCWPAGGWHAYTTRSSQKHQTMAPRCRACARDGPGPGGTCPVGGGGWLLSEEQVWPGAEMAAVFLRLRNAGQVCRVALNMYPRDV